MYRRTRRNFLSTCAYTLGAGTGLSLLPRSLFATSNSVREPFPTIRDERIKALALRGLDAARNAGATYADIRLTRTHERLHTNDRFSYEKEGLHVGIRALKDGYWGFAASAVWSPDEVVRLGRESVRYAAANSLGKPREILLPPVLTVVDGHWETPVKIDPWTVNPLEIADVLDGITNNVHRELKNFDRAGNFQGGVITRATFYLSEQAFASTEGSYLTQRLHWTEGLCEVESRQYNGGSGGLLTPKAAGWEYIKDQPIVETVLQNVQEWNEIGKLPIKPLDVGRYDVVFDAQSVAELVSKTLGAATEIDRVLGFEANATGTSYLKDPKDTLGKTRVGSPMLTITANRNEPGSVATVQWDSEGVTPEPFTLIEKGVVADFQTNREGAGWLKDTYSSAGLPIRSHGCAFARTGKDVPLVHTANLVMTPGSEPLTMADLESGIGKGISFVQFRPDVDFQCSGGSGGGLALEIKDGKRVARLASQPGVLFQTQELWKNLLAIGGRKSAYAYATGFFTLRSDLLTKGQPEQNGCHSVTAFPIAVKDVSIVDQERRS